MADEGTEDATWDLIEVGDVSMDGGTRHYQQLLSYRGMSAIVWRVKQVQRQYHITRNFRNGLQLLQTAFLEEHIEDTIELILPSDMNNLLFAARG